MNKGVFACGENPYYPWLSSLGESVPRGVCDVEGGWGAPLPPVVTWAEQANKQAD